MEKASEWLRALLRLTKKTPKPTRKPPNKCWCFVTCNNTNNKDDDHHIKAVAETSSHNEESNKQVTAMAATNNGAVEVVRLRSTRRSTSTNSNWLLGCQVWAAVKIQSHFRAYLSRKALRALKSVVKMQALVRGHIVRKQTANNIRRVHALLRVQARARARRSKIFESQPIFYDHKLFRNDSSSDEKVIDGKVFPKSRNRFHSSQLSLCLDKYSQTLTTSKELSVHGIATNISPAELQSLGYLNLFQNPEDGYYYTAFTASKSDCSRKYVGAFSEHPNYMSFTKSSKAKMRSLSAPKQRMQYERSSSATRDHTNNDCYDFRLNSQRTSELQAKFADKLYPGSGRLERLGVATGGDNHLHRV